jgi:hypothetical protein
VYKSLALVDQNDLEFLVPSDSDNYVRGKLVSGAGEDVDLTDTKELAKKNSSTYCSVSGTSLPTASPSRIRASTIIIASI